MDRDIEQTVDQMVRLNGYPDPHMRVGSLFSGYGGLDLAVGGELAWVCDNDPGAYRILAYRAPDAPNLGDITTIDWATVQPVDVITGGWPCQPFSLAGKQKGAADERALWPEVARAVRVLRPRYVVLENVAAVAAVGELARAVGDLASLGYVGQWRRLRAADVGAPHGRARIFILARDATISNGQRTALRLSSSSAGQKPIRGSGDSAAANTESKRSQRNRDTWQRRTGPADNGGGAATDTSGNGWGEGWPEPTRQFGGPDVAQRSATLTDAEGSTRRGTQPEHLGQTVGSAAELGERPGVAWGVYEPAIRRWEHILGRPAPAPTEPSRNGGRRLSPAFVEFMMGLPAGWVTAVPGLTRNAQLKALGNGVVPQQAAAALQLLGGLDG